MKDQKLLASIALFRELYDSKKDIYDVITNFIRSAMVLDSCWVLDSSKCSSLLRETYGFDLPEAVVKTCLKSRLKKNGELEIKNGKFYITEKFDKTNILSSYDDAVSDYDKIISLLIDSVRKIRVSDECINSDLIAKCFNEYILNPNYKNEYSNEISHFIISNKDNYEFKESLRKIEEGLILYTGIKYTAGINELGSWDNDLTIFLDTEILFSAAGFNGELYLKLFKDFHGLVDDANQSKNRNGKIKLCYFLEVEDEINSFFYAAERVFVKNESIDPSKTAMHQILNGCQSRSDVVAKKVIFFENLKKLKIIKEDSVDYYDEPQYNLESSETIIKLKDKFNHRDDEEEYSRILKLFTKINFVRKGENSVGIDKVKAILISAKRLTLHSAFSDIIRKDSKNIPYATHIDFMTERLWFKLNKGFGGNQSIPTSFQAVTKAQLVLSSQISSKVTKEYKKLQSQLENGKITRSVATQINTELRVKPSKPEDLDTNNVSGALEFLSDDLIEKALREKSILEEKSKYGEVVNKHLKKLKNDDKREERKILAEKLKKKYCYLTLIMFLIFPTFSFIIVFLTKKESDSYFTLISGGITLLAFLIQIISIKPTFRSHFRNKLPHKLYPIALEAEFDALEAL